MGKFMFVSATAGYWDAVKEALPIAGVNTVLGIATVFVALIFISFIISLFKFISVIEKKMADKKAAKELPAQAVEQTVTQIAVKEQADMDDLELIAVITAAIQAYEEAQGNDVAGDLVVRSIRKVNKSRWQNA